MRGLAFSLLSLSSVSAAPQADEVHALPGWDAPLPSRWWSGFLEVAGSQKRIHYTLIEKIGDPNAAQAPVVMWTNGGPGCSGYDGLFYEHGPLLISHDGTELVKNEHTWANHANMLYLEAPAGVGFSYSTNDADYHTGDNKTAADNHAALVDFFSKFPEYRQNDLYISGESYGGVYVPTLSHKIFEDKNFPGNMRGFLCGNCVFDSCGSTSIPFSYGHGALSQDMYDDAVEACGSPYFNRSSDACQVVKSKAREMTEGLNIYDFYRDCYHSEEQEGKLRNFDPWRVAEDGDRHHLREQVQIPRPPHPAVAAHHRKKLGASVGENVPCIDSAGGTIWLNRPDVQAALHVENSTIHEWSICSNVLDYEDDGVYPTLSPLYRDMMQSYRIIVYNGDTDPGCNYLGDEWCVKQLGAPVKATWTPWHYNDASVTSQGKQVGGWTETYQVGGELRFITVKGAGHMAPQWRPAAAEVMFSQFVSAAPFTSRDHSIVV